MLSLSTVGRRNQGDNPPRGPSLVLHFVEQVCRVALEASLIRVIPLYSPSLLPWHARAETVLRSLPGLGNYSTGEVCG